MEEANCLICKGSEFNLLLEVPNRLKRSEIFTLQECQCGFVYLSPRPDVIEINDYYLTREYDPHNRNKSGIWNSAYQTVQNYANYWKYMNIRKFFKSGTLLDIGGGNGSFANFMKQKGWDVILQDNSKQAIVNSQSIGIKTVVNLSEIEQKPKFTVITLWHSIEHIHDIEELFASIRKLLLPGGILLIAVPNLNAPEKKYFGKNWSPYDAPRHLYQFTLSTLSKLCRNEKFNIIRKYSMVQDTPYNILLSLSSFSPIQLLKGLFILIISIGKIFFIGSEYASSFMIICKKQ